MKNVLIDQTGELRCPKCHAKHFDVSRPAGAFLAMGLGGLAAKKQANCLVCGYSSKTGKAERWMDPALVMAQPDVQPTPQQPAKPQAFTSRGGINFTRR